MCDSVDDTSSAKPIERVSFIRITKVCRPHVRRSDILEMVVEGAGKKESSNSYAHTPERGHTYTASHQILELEDFRIKSGNQFSF